MRAMKRLISTTCVLFFLSAAHAAPSRKAAPDAGPPAPPPSADVKEDAFTQSVMGALTLHKRGEDGRALRLLWEAVDEARARAPLDVHDGVVLADYPENLGIYRPAKGGMVFNNTLLLYLEVDNHGLRKRPEGFEVDLWTDVFILYEDGERIGGKEHFGTHKLISTVPYRTTHLVLEVAVSGLPAQPYQALVVVHDAASGKEGKIFIPFRVAAKPGAH
jgi:hypothetical protein